jgi:hypothetical protein
MPPRSAKTGISCLESIGIRPDSTKSGPVSLVPSDIDVRDPGLRRDELREHDRAANALEREIEEGSPLYHLRARLVLNGLHRFDYRGAVYVRALPTDPQGRSV